MTNPTGQTGVEGLRAALVDSVDGRRFDTGFPELDYEEIEWLVDNCLLPRVNRFLEAHTSAVLDRVEKGMPEVIGPNIPNIKGAVMYTYANNILAEQRTKFTDLMKKVREEI